MYVRTKKGEIFDCYESEQMHKPIYYPKKSKTNGYIDYEDVYKKSDNLIDILQVGDYVNGYRVDYIENINKNNNFILQRIFCEEYEKDLYSKSFKPSDIKSVVTKEQFEQMAYKVNENGNNSSNDKRK